MAVRDRLREVAVGTTAGVAAAYAHEMWRRRAETEMLDGKPTRLEKMDPATITTDPETFQFKSGGDKHGVTDRLKGVKKWDAVAAGKAMVFEKLDGTRVIADGHQRHGLAKRLGAEGQHVRMDGYVMREADGWTPRDVRAYAALKNMQESSGLSLDMAKVMRERPDLVSADRLPMSDAKVREARALSNLSDQAFRMVVGGAVKPEHAAAVGDQVKDQARHADMLAEMQKAKVDSAQHARLYVQQAMAAPSITQSQSSLFGEETSTRSLLAERAKVLDRALSALKTDKRIFGLLEREASNIEAAGNKLAHASNVDRANNAGQLASLVEKLSTTRGTVSTMLDRAAAAVANGDAPSKAARSFVKSVGDAMKQGGIGALTGEAPGHMQEHLHPIYRPKEKGTTPEAAEKWGKILDELPVSEKQKARVDRAKQEGQNKLPSRMKRMEDDLFGGPSAKDQIAAKARAQEAKGRTGDPMNEGLFGSGMKQTDLVEMAKQPAAAENTYKMKHRPMDLVAKTRASRDADRGLPAQGSGLRGTQNKANQEAIIKNRKVNAKPASPRAVAAATFKAELGHEPPKNWPVGKINGTIGNLRGLYGADAKTVYAGSVKGASPEVRAAADAAHMASVKNGGPVKPAAPRVVIDPMKLGQARLDTAKAQAAVAKATGSKSFAAAGLHNAAEADKRWNQVEAAAKSAGVKDIGEQMKDVLGTGQPSAEKPATTGKGTGRGTGKKALGLLAPVAIGAAALVAANRSAEAGESKGKQAAAAGAEVGNGAGMFAAFAGGTAIAVKGLMKAGVTAAKAIPGVNLAMVAGGAVHGAATAEKGERLSGAAKGAWDMSLPGMAWNTGAVFKDAAVSTFARATGPVRLSADQQTAYARASERQQAMKQAATSPDSSKKHGWSNAARIAAYKKRQQNAGANPANVPYGGNPSNGPAQWAPSQSQTDVAAAMKRR